MLNNFNPNQTLINDLYRQKNSIDGLISQVMGQQQMTPPVQNIINTNGGNYGNGVMFEARMMNKDEDISNIAVNTKTLFVNEDRKKIYIKEVDGTISKTYDIIVPLDEKDKKIIELEKRIKEMEKAIDVKLAESNEPNEYEQQQNAVFDKSTKSKSKTISKSVSK